MTAYRDLLTKWGAYGVSALVLMLLHALTLHTLAPFGVMTFLPPVLVGVVASLEEARPATIFGLALGVACDLTVAAPFPCLYTLAFTASALLASLLAKSVLQPGVLRSVIVTALTFAVTDLGNILVLAMRGAQLGPMLLLALKETVFSCLLLVVCHPLLTALHRKFTL